MTVTSIEKYIEELAQEELLFKNGLEPEATVVNGKKNKLQVLSSSFLFILKCVVDFFVLHFNLLFEKNKNKKIVFTNYNFCTIENGKYEDRIFKPLFTEDIIFINQSKEIYISKINNQKVYNLGGITKVLKFFFFKYSSKMQYFKSFQFINDTVFRRFRSKEIFLVFFYDLNNLSIVFSKHRPKLHLTEVQHGSMINYPPYAKPSKSKVIDTFYVKNVPTIHYLQEHLCKNFTCEYKIIPYPKKEMSYQEGTHILYASTVDFNGFHPAFTHFLATNKLPNLHIKIRLHPRERTPEKEILFRKELDKYTINYTFDNSKNWVEANSIQNLVVISPWSSCIEDSFDNNLKSIVIDTAGKERYKHLIDGKMCYFSRDIENILLEIAKQNDK